MKHFIHFAFFLLFIFSSFTAHSQATDKKTTYRFRTFSPEGGFYYDGINSVVQDKDGFVWILMDNDLYRFDGYQYKRYYSQFKEIVNQEENIFSSITVDKSGRLFVACTNTLCQYNKSTDSFKKIYQTTADDISSLRFDEQGTLWMNLSGKFGRYNEKSKEFEMLLHDDKQITGINMFIKDDTGFFILSHGKNIYRYNYETNECSHFFELKNGEYCNGICRVHNSLWIYIKNEGLCRIDIPTAQIEERYNTFFEKEERKGLFVKMIYADKYEHIWIASQRGLYIFDPEAKQYTHYTHSITDPFSIPNNSIWNITEDMQKNIWIGTYSGGLCYVNLDEKAHFNSYTPINTELNHKLISGFVENSQYLWIATEGGGLNCMDKNTKHFKHFMNDPKHNSLPSNNVKSIVMDNEQSLWLALFRGGLSNYNTKTKQFTNYKYDSKDKNSLCSNDLRKIVLETDSGLWIAYQLRKLVISFYSFEKQTFTHYYFDETDSNQFIFDICQGSDDQLWIVTHKRLYALDKKTGAVKKIPFSNLSYPDAQTLCIDGANNVWIGTIGKGLIRYNINTAVFSVFDDILKFDVSSIYSICTDNENNLWLGTDNGLFKYKIAQNKFLRFDKQDGVQGQVFYPLATYKNKNGDLYFGGTNGFSIINPKNIGQNQFNPEVIISDFLIDNVSAIPPVYGDSMSLSNIVSFPAEIVLNHKQSNFGFTFSSNNYFFPEKNRFRYRLKGYDNRWIEADAKNRSVFYTKVPAGNYVFEVLAANNDGIWSDTPKQITIKRQAPPLLSWWAYLVYLLLISGVAYLVMKYYNNQKKLKMQLYLDKLDKDKKEEIHQSQLRFFTNISHDFRTPIALISAAVERLRKDGLKEYYYRILSGNTQRLLGLVNELMDFRTVENGKMPLQLTENNINELVKKIAFDFKDYALQRNISFEVRTDSNLPESLFVDKVILEKVVMNLLNNAFKYTKDGGSIQICTYANVDNFTSNYENTYIVSDEKNPANHFAIVVRDTGIGISKDSIESIFERFYKVKTVNFDSHLGTGIGLALVKSLVLLHYGKIAVCSEREKGTDFIVCFTTDANSYKESDFLKEDTISTEKVKEQKHIEKTQNIEKELSDEELIKDKRRILLAEDNEDLRTMIADYLSTKYEIIEAEDGLAASQQLEKMRIDLIISDIMMPRKDGITLCVDVKKNSETSHIPIILLTAKTAIESKLEGVDAGADMYFEKPIDFELLLRSIQNIFKQQTQLREYYSKHYFAENTELTNNQQEGDFIRKFITILDKHIDQSEMDVNLIASELSMSRSKLYNKIKSISGKSIVEFILNYRLRKAARLIVENDMSMREVMEKVGIESQSYFTRSFKKEFGETPSNFASKHKKLKKTELSDDDENDEY